MTRAAAGTLLIFATIVATTRLRFVHDLPEWDVATYSLIGREIVHGRRLYADIWDMKPPAIFASYAAANAVLGGAGGSWQWPAYALAVATSIATMIGVYFAAASVDRRAGLWAAGLWASVSIAPALGGIFPNAEAFINALLAMGFAAVMRAGPKTLESAVTPSAGEELEPPLSPSARGTGRSVLASVAFALASFYKHVAIVPAVAIAIANVVIATKPDRRRAIKQSLLVVAMIPLGWLLLFGYFAATGRGRLFFDTAIAYPWFYASTSAAEPVQVLPRNIVEMLPLTMLALLAGVVSMWRRSGGGWRIASMWLAYAIGAAIAVVVPGRFFDHYWQLLLPPLAIAAGWGAAWLWAMRPALVPRAAAVLVVVGTIVLQRHWFAGSPRDRAAEMHPASLFLDVARGGEEIRSLLRDDETFYAWCTEPQLYLIAGKRPPAAGLWKPHMIDGPIAPWLTRRTLEDLERAPPDMIVMWSGSPGPEDHPIYRWIVERYDPMPGNANRFPLSFLARRGSDLQQRANGGHR